MLIFALLLAPAAPSALSEIHQRDIACVVEIAVQADAQKRGIAGGTDVQANGKRWAGIVGDRIVFETGQPREVVALAMQEVAQASATKPRDGAVLDACTRQMLRELDAASAADQPLPKPVQSK
jgi:hypothetical protein